MKKKVTAQVLSGIITAIYRASVGAQFTVCPLGIALAVPSEQLHSYAV